MPEPTLCVYIVIVAAVCHAQARTVAQRQAVVSVEMETIVLKQLVSARNARNVTPSEGGGFPATLSPLRWPLGSMPQRYDYQLFVYAFVGVVFDARLWSEYTDTDAIFEACSRY